MLAHLDKNGVKSHNFFPSFFEICTKRMARFPKGIAHIYVILYCNHFSILSKGTNCEKTTRDPTEQVIAEMFLLAPAENRV